MAYVVLGCQWLLAAVFGVAAVSKLRRSAFEEFVASLRRLLPTRLSGWQQPAASAVVVVEVTTVALLFMPRLVSAGFVLAAAFGAVLTAVTTVESRRGKRAPCHCFGSSGVPLGWAHMGRNVLLTSVAAAGLLLATTASLEPVAVSGGVVAVLVALAAAALTIRMDDLVALFLPASARR